MADAKKVAEAVVSEEVSEVLVFGSVARGEAGTDSDIDLVAVYDDLDYSTRWERSTELGRLASAAAGRRVFVYVTDWPEWTRRAAEVSSSLERAVAGYAVALHRRPPNGVSWGKEIGKPATDREEAAARLDNARRALFGVATHLPMGPEERYALEDGDPGYYVFRMRDRLCALCADAQMAMETGLKALIHLGGIRPARTHDLGRLLGALPAARGDVLRRMFVDITPEEASMWREAARIRAHRLVIGEPCGPRLPHGPGRRRRIPLRGRLFSRYRSRPPHPQSGGAGRSRARRMGPHRRRRLRHDRPAPAPRTAPVSSRPGESR